MATTELPVRRTEPTLTRWRRTIRRFLPGLAGTALLALTCNLALELSRLAGVDGYPWKYKTPAFGALFLLGSGVVWLLVGLVQAVVGRLWLTTTLTLTATAVVAVADHEKVRLRREPLYPSDWEFTGDIGFLKDMVGIRVVLLLALGVLVLGAGVFVGARAVRRRFAARSARARPAWSGPAGFALRVVTGVLCLLSLGYLAHFNSPGNAARGAYDLLGATWRPWSQQRNYLGNGFVGGFLYNLDVPSMSRPPDYSAAEMARIAATYRRAAEQINRTRDPGGLEDVNVVMVLSESFSDPLALRGVHVGDDPIPFTRRLLASTTSGAMLAQGIGGGTANMEFEALTGMSVSQFPPQVRVPYQMLVPDYETFPSAARWLGQTGHRAIAIHPFTTEMYRRRDVYRSFGFDEFVYDRRMHDRRRIGHDAYISDAAAFDELVGRLGSEHRPLFVNLVTMQNHMPYQGRYDDPVAVTGPDGEPLTDLGQYVRGLEYSDRAVKGLVDRLRGLDERTVVAFYGDHLPGLYPDSVHAVNGPRRMRETPFFVWANFPGPQDALPTTSPTHVMDLVLERAGAAVPPYYALLHELRREVPAMNGGLLLGSANRPLREGQLSERAARLLHDYRLVQYDLSVGERYGADAMFRPVPG